MRDYVARYERIMKVPTVGTKADLAMTLFSMTMHFSGPSPTRNWHIMKSSHTHCEGIMKVPINEVTLDRTPWWPIITWSSHDMKDSPTHENAYYSLKISNH